MEVGSFSEPEPLISMPSPTSSPSVFAGQTPRRASIPPPPPPASRSDPVPVSLSTHRPIGEHKEGVDGEVVLVTGTN